ncbi:MFS transporter [Paraburkholderia tropica]|uniref:MFS transporter n=1 Tax=Paraburkholderia tropica TaxID=92647 RepID=UPI002AB108BC|nr:MFS transporter [Paraburkholderia tropica]
MLVQTHQQAIDPGQSDDDYNIAGRLERIPTSRWHVRVRLIVGTATFFDAFDMLALSSALPVLVKLWHLTHAQVGTLIASGFAGQILGAFAFGWLADRIGRVRALQYNIMLFSLMALGCALSPNYTTLLVCRVIQGVGIGGEVPIAASYINELTRAHKRGKFVLLYEIVFSIGVLLAGFIGAILVPRLGWQSVFVLGCIPAVIALVMRRSLPESPRWLAGKGRFREADAVVTQIENYTLRAGLELPCAPRIPVVSVPRSRVSELLGAKYLRRTLSVWTLWFCVYFVTYGVITWLPTIYVSVFHFDLQTALTVAAASSVVSVPMNFLLAFIIDRIGRRRWFTIGLALGAVPLVAIWLLGTQNHMLVVVLAALSYMFTGPSCSACYLYTPELYPTRLRVVGSSVATVWLRIASTIGPFAVGMILTYSDYRSVFLMFAVVALIGSVVIGCFGEETSERVLEDLSQ